MPSESATGSDTPIVILSVLPSTGVGSGAGTTDLHNGNDSFIGGNGTNNSSSNVTVVAGGDDQVAQLHALSRDSLFGVVAAVGVVVVVAAVACGLWCYRRVKSVANLSPKRASVSDDIQSQMTNEVAAAGASSKFPQRSRQLSVDSTGSVSSDGTAPITIQASGGVSCQNHNKILDVSSIPLSPKSRAGVVTAINPVAGLVQRTTPTVSGQLLTEPSPTLSPASLVKPRKLQPLQVANKVSNDTPVVVSNVFASLASTASPKPPVKPQLASPSHKIPEYSSSPLRKSSVHDIDDDITSGVEKVIVSPTVIVPQFQRRPTRRNMVSAGSTLTTPTRPSPNPEVVRSALVSHPPSSITPSVATLMTPSRALASSASTDVVTESPLAAVIAKKPASGPVSHTTTVWQGVTSARAAPVSTTSSWRNPAYGVHRSIAAQAPQPVTNLTTSLEGLLRPRRMPPSQHVRVWRCIRQRWTNMVS